MNIRNRLILLSSSFTVVIAVTSLMMILGLRSINKAMDNSRDVGQIVKDVFELNIITHQYLLHSEKRMQQQWMMNYDSFGRLLERLKTEKKDQPFAGAIEKIHSNYGILGDLFFKIQTNFENRKNLIRNNRPETEITRTLVLQERLAAQILVNAQRIIFDAYALSGEIQNRSADLQRRIRWIVLSAAIGFITLTIGISFFAVRSITVPMRKLVEGVKTVGAGNLEHRLSVDTQNEIGQLSRAFDQMIADLKEITVSRNELDQRVKERTKELQAANAELSQYAYVVSHDLKAPLRAIHNYSDFLREDLEAKLDGDQKSYLDGLNRAVSQGEELVNDLLTLSRIERSKDVSETVDVGLLIHELSTTMGLPENVELEIGNGLPAVKTDRILLTQIFRNLIDNAVKFNDAQIKRIRIGSHAESEKEPQEIFVQDNGIGIEKRFFDKIFQVFQRLHTRSEYEGTGIGLAIVKKAVGKIGGEIRVDSEPGKGSTFFIHIPFAEKGAQR